MIPGITGGLNIRKMNESTYRILDSSNLSKDEAQGIIANVGHKVIFSENRILDDLIFTTDSIAPKSFKKLICPDSELEAAFVWKTINATRSLRVDRKPVTFENRIVSNSPEEFEKLYFETVSSKPMRFSIDFQKLISSKAKVLDLGCGKGVNFLPLLAAGLNVTAVDRSQYMLNECIKAVSKKALDNDHLSCMRNNLSLIQADIATCNIAGQKFNVIICADVLPYIESTKLKSVMDRIHDLLLPNGLFFGNLYYINPEGSAEEECLGHIGAHFYPDPALVPAMLKHSGFIIKKCSIRLGEEGLQTVQFIVTKPETQISKTVLEEKENHL